MGLEYKGQPTVAKLLQVAEILLTCRLRTRRLVLSSLREGGDIVGEPTTLKAKAGVAGVGAALILARRRG